MRRGFLKLMLMAGISALFMPEALARPRFKPVAAGLTALVRMRYSPFPYRGTNPDKHEPFLNTADGKRHGHISPQGVTYWEDETYSDRRTLFSIPKGFNLSKPAALVVFFHGNFSTLERDVQDRQHIPAQLAESGVNAVLAAPQFAVNARDSSPGNFWQPGYFSKWLAEVGAELAKLHGQHAKAAEFDRLPVILVAYSGGYYPAAWCLKLGGAGKRVGGLVLFDALYGDEEKFAQWIAARHKSAFVFSAYSQSARRSNRDLQVLLAGEGVHFQRGFPEKLVPASIYFGETPEYLDHKEFMSQAWAPDPLRWVLERVGQFRGRVD